MDTTGYTPEEPIAAVATALVPSALGIVRASGKGCIELVSHVFSRPAALCAAAGNTIVYGWIKDGGHRIDEVLVSVFRAPKSFTGEDMVEISCHGGPAVVTAVFNLLLANDPNRDPAENYKVACVLCHIVLPIMYTADWLLFYERGNVQKTWPVLSALFPLSYLLFVFIHGAVLRFDSTILNYTGSDPLIFPYFFLNPARVGFGGVLLWCVMLLAAFLAGGFIFMAVDHLLKKIIR